MASLPRRTIIAAHRGGAQLWPENSLTAFRGALALPVEQVETDIHRSSDGEPFILHDPTLDRTTEGTGIAAERTWQELSRVCLRHTASDTIPHLDDLLALMQPTTMALRLELKKTAAGAADPGLFRRAVASLDRANMTPRTTFTSFDLRYLAEVQASGFGVGHIWLVARDIIRDQGVASMLDQARAATIAEVAIHASQISDNLVAAVRNSGVDLGFYGVNDAAAIEAAFDKEASAITTDRPDLAIAARNRRKG